jgi:hypothetical protein
VNNVMIFIAFFAVLFTKKWPRGMFDFSLQIQRWTANVLAYGFLLLRDEYPPFSGDSGDYPLTLEVEYRDDLSRWMIFVKWLLVIPLDRARGSCNRGIRRCDHCLLRDPVHRALPAWNVRLRGWHLPMARTGQRVRDLVHDRPLPAL